MPYEYDQKSVLANGIYPVANAIEMDALLLLPGILFYHFPILTGVLELDGELDVTPAHRIPNPDMVANDQLPGERHHHFAALL